MANEAARLSKNGDVSSLIQSHRSLRATQCHLQGRDAAWLERALPHNEDWYEHPPGESWLGWSLLGIVDLDNIVDRDAGDNGGRRG